VRRDAALKTLCILENRAGVQAGGGVPIGVFHALIVQLKNIRIKKA
jgi:hypothetical protein